MEEENFEETTEDEETSDEEKTEEETSEDAEEASEEKEEVSEKKQVDRFNREMFKATCADCGKECEVPFKPSGDRPVYCRDCYQKHAPKRRY